jgi:3-methylcrotonyl-CoA carboxylase alpha subunit
MRIDSGVEEGAIVGPFYDAMLAKVIAVGRSRGDALSRLAGALESTRIAGPRTNIAFLMEVIGHPYFRAGGVDTGLVDRDLPRLVGPPLETEAATGAIGQWARWEADRHAACTPGPWARIDGYELGGLQRNLLMPVAVEGEPGTADPFRAMEDAAAGGETAGDAEVIWAGREAFVLSRGRQLRVAFPDPLDRSMRDAALGGEISAPMPGRVIDVAVVPGQHVKKGDPLFTLEAMKMEHAVTAPVAGTIVEVRAAPGEQVERDAIILVIEAADREG